MKRWASPGRLMSSRDRSYYREMVKSQTPAIIGEPTLLSVVHAHKGVGGFRVISHGKAAHSSTRDGVNANLAMIPFLQEMLSDLIEETETDPAMAE
jgi:acetylornithine deacetylase